MNDIIELLANYGPMTASEITLELGRDLASVERDLAQIPHDGFSTYRLGEQ